ncbi:VOC family protein [Gordonia sp. NPDC003424]
MMSLTAIRVTDLSASAEFYSAGCGFVQEREFSTADFDAVILRAGAAGVELIRATGDGARRVSDHGNMLVKLVLNVSDVADRIERACAAGGTQVTAATDMPQYGMTIGVVDDPDGYRIEFVGRS